jgi:hypothetical protein
MSHAEPDADMLPIQLRTLVERILSQLHREDRAASLAKLWRANFGCFTSIERDWFGG